MNSHTNVLTSEVDYNPAEWDSRAYYDNWVADCIATDDSNDAQAAQIPFITLTTAQPQGPSQPALAPLGLRPNLSESYTVDSINECFNCK
jgi:hypothetical protein